MASMWNVLSEGRSWPASWSRWGALWPGGRGGALWPREALWWEHTGVLQGALCPLYSGPRQHLHLPHLVPSGQVPGPQGHWPRGCITPPLQSQSDLTPAKSRKKHIWRTQGWGQGAWGRGREHRSPFSPTEIHLPKAPGGASAEPQPLPLGCGLPGLQRRDGRGRWHRLSALISSEDFWIFSLNNIPSLPHPIPQQLGCWKPVVFPS